MSDMKIFMVLHNHQHVEFLHLLLQYVLKEHVEPWSTLHP